MWKDVAIAPQCNWGYHQETENIGGKVLMHAISSIATSAFKVEVFPNGGAKLWFSMNVTILLILLHFP